MVKFSVKTFCGNCICDNRTWEHITESHRIMEDNEEAIKDTLEYPLWVYQSDEWEKRDVYFGRSNKASYGDNLFTKVVVENTDHGRPNEVVSAWPQKDITGNIKEGGVKYVDGKLGQKK